MTKNLKTLLGIYAILGSSAALQADLIETKDGARLVGKISKIADGAVTLSTAYAGDITIKQSEITSLSSDEAVAVRLASGTRIEGKIQTEGTEVKIKGKDGTLTTSVAQVAASWPAGNEDPQVSSMRRHWSFVTATDITGNSGNTTSSTVGLSFVASLSNPQDALKFYGSYNYATTTTAKNVTPRVKTKSSDQTKAGVDYSSFFSEKYGWFVRSELGKDSVAGVSLRSTSDFGATMRFINDDTQSLVARLGAGYRFESYITGPDNKGAVLSTALDHSYVLNKYATIVTGLQYLPSFNDFADYRFVQDTAVEVPISGAFWKLRLGFANQYNSRPLAGRESLDSLYYTRLILNWK